MPMVVVNPPASAFNIQPLTETPAIAPALDELAVFSDSAVAMRKVKVANLYPNGGLSGAKLAPNSVPNSALAPASIANDRIALATIDSTRVAAGGLATANYADLSVTAAKLANDTITTAKLSTNLKNIGRCAIFEERRSSGSAAAAFSSGAISGGGNWAIRALDTTSVNEVSLGITFNLATATASVPAGAWLIEGWAASGGSSKNILMLWSGSAAWGSVGMNTNGGSTAFVQQVLTFASTSAVQLRHVFSGALSLGSPATMGTPEIYSALKITKLG